MIKVSVIMPIYNADRFVRKAIVSLQEQTFSNWELLAVDDASQDSSADLVSSMSRVDPRIRLIRQPTNKGAAAARNVGIEAARARFIAFLDADDRWFPEKLERQIRFMDRRGVVFSYTAYQKVAESDGSCVVMGVPDKVNYNSLLKTNVIGCLTAVYDASFFGKVYMPDSNREDFGLWLQLLKDIDYAYGINIPMAQYKVRNDSSSADKLKAGKDTWRLYRDIERLSFFQSIYYFCHYSAGGVLRSRFPYISKYLGILHDAQNFEDFDNK